MTAQCEHGYPRDGWPCIRRKCIDASGRTYAAAVHAAAREKARLAARTPEDVLVDELRELWGRHPEQQSLINALAEYALAAKALREAAA